MMLFHLLITLFYTVLCTYVFVSLNRYDKKIKWLLGIDGLTLLILSTFELLSYFYRDSVAALQMLKSIYQFLNIIYPCTQLLVAFRYQQLFVPDIIPSIVRRFVIVGSIGISFFWGIWELVFGGVYELFVEKDGNLVLRLAPSRADDYFLQWGSTLIILFLVFALEFQIARKSDKLLRKKWFYVMGILNFLTLLLALLVFLHPRNGLSFDTFFSVSVYCLGYTILQILAFTDFSILRISMANTAETFMDTLSNWTVLTDENFEIMETNLAFVRAVGSTSQHLLGTSLVELISITDERTIKQSLWELTLRKNSTPLTLQVNQQSYHVQINAKPLTTSKNKIYGYVWVFTDLTNIEEIRIHKEALENTNEDLKMVLSTTSADLKSSLLIIDQLIYLLKAKTYESDDQYQAFVSGINEHTVRMRGVINKIIALLRNRSFEKMHEDVDTDEVLEVIVDKMKEIIKQTNATIEWEGLPTLKGDKVLITQIFQNIINNAIRYRSTQAPFIKISVEIKDGRYCFSIRDNGRGFPKPTYRQFASYFNTQESYKMENPGIGMLLNKRITEKYGGEIHIQPNMPQGTEIQFTWPVQPAC